MVVARRVWVVEFVILLSIYYPLVQVGLWFMWGCGDFGFVVVQIGLARVLVSTLGVGSSVFKLG